MYNPEITTTFINQILVLIDNKMDELVGRGDYIINVHNDNNRIYVSFRSGDLNESEEMANDVILYINNHFERNLIKLGNFGKTLFWVTWGE